MGNFTEVVTETERPIVCALRLIQSKRKARSTVKLGSLTSAMTFKAVAGTAVKEIFYFNHKSLTVSLLRRSVGLVESPL